ncbi:MarR family winged helix-turn-helix transcriptional regulator [Bernardetia sp. OM2101]|uniref:MarR family winged helix-turn-helix transcriptional regulator n=1 Tax=Bernardetia sp. OM2101 TaxID=3344876 RepID=UPI0035CF59A5
MNKEILREIGKIYRSLNSFSDFLMKSINLEKGQYQFLMRVKENQGINQQNLSSLLLVDKTTTAKAISKLITKGYILKKVDQDDKRNSNLYLTSKGEEICVFLEKEEQFSTKVALENLTNQQQEILLNQLKEISKNTQSLYSKLKNDEKEYYLKIINQEKL